MKKQTVTVTLSALLSLCLAFCAGCAKNSKTAAISSKAVQLSESSSAVENSLESTAAPSSAEVITSSLTAEDAAETVLPRAARSAKVSKAAKPAAKVRTVVPVAAIFNTHKQSNNLDIDHNVFMDALEYTGYNLKKHRADGNMWKYIYAADKRGMGYLSSISYGGASSGYEVTGGKPDVAAMAKKGGLVCASYVTYVYFNYLPNVAGISTSMLDKPAKPINANDWKIAAGKWVQKGYSRYIPFTAKILPSKYTVFQCAQTVPIGSILIFADAKKAANNGTHVAIYGGFKNGYNWVYHVGNANGPEFCAIERMGFGPDPQRLIQIITPPSVVQYAASLEVTVLDDSGTALSGVRLTAKNHKNGKSYSVGVTNQSGKTIAKDLPFGQYTVTQTVLGGYTGQSSYTVTLTGKSNAKGSLKIVNTRKMGAIMVEVTGKNGLPLTGAAFAVLNSQGKEVARLGPTGANGKATLTGSKSVPLYFGSYTVKQCTAPKGYLLNEKAFAVTLSEANSKATLSLQNVADLTGPETSSKATAAESAE